MNDPISTPRGVFLSPDALTIAADALRLVSEMETHLARILDLLTVGGHALAALAPSAGVGPMQTLFGVVEEQAAAAVEVRHEAFRTVHRLAHPERHPT